ncbi:hypothetical protein [Paramicrobacterium agarici]|uniref:hypothetical protein n=1 Tax=Paramicrobacterium agarici TaxID=630514 RepID=UPI00116D04B2|nr:hypothetical protein [Microbacterium agarici]TQO21310.1 hypothetical protein FB385_0108 [Microbacterium agarici]
MVPTEQAGSGAGRYDRFFRRVEDKLIPVIGPATIGPYSDVYELQPDDSCPVCGHAMEEHSTDRSSGNAVLNCPVEAEPVSSDTSPLNELGMPTESARRRAERHNAST